MPHKRQYYGLLLKLIVDLIGHMTRYVIRTEMLSFIYKQFLNFWKGDRKMPGIFTPDQRTNWDNLYQWNYKSKLFFYIYLIRQFSDCLNLRDRNILVRDSWIFCSHKCYINAITISRPFLLMPSMPS